LEAARREGVLRVVLAGGVAANSRLRSKVEEEGTGAGIAVYLPTKALCTDNAAMVALLGERRLAAGRVCGLDLNAYAASRFSR
ncbi:MAG: tRNA (adenosine(37)-N6)-threonylcarbamoyltransferase complex transferase subunit TsaD, partial [Deltaproteobacteria bacterium]|nr:tRNA (adenosine(37)-N6)-threonylcarbamoyltransferase complex transferase subunit TsaD [Deltaproteobacteria bacterium]